jgi:hypothetical protein
LEEDEFINIQNKGKTQEAKIAIGSTVAELDNPKLAAPKAEPKPVAEKATPVAEKETEEEPVKRVKKAEVEEPKDINAVLDDWA